MRGNQGLSIVLLPQITQRLDNTTQVVRRETVFRFLHCYQCKNCRFQLFNIEGLVFTAEYGPPDSFYREYQGQIEHGFLSVSQTREGHKLLSVGGRKRDR